MATTQEAKSKGKLLLDSVRSLNWQSLLAAAIIAAL
jgi:hypothetical protein